MHLSGNVIKSLGFESGDRERTLLAAAGESFCFPLMERDLMDTRLKNMLENAQDLSLMAFMDARCAARQLKDESSSKSAVADLEVKVATLEQEKDALQQCLEKSAVERDTLTTELLAMAERAVKAEDAAKAAKKLAEDAESSREVMHTRLRTFKEAIKIGSEKLEEELLALLAKYGLVAPDIFPEGTDTVGLGSFFQWLRAYVAMVEAGARFHEDISDEGPALLSPRRKLPLARRGGRSPGDAASHGLEYPKNFMDHFFKGEGRAIVQREVKHMKPLVRHSFALLCWPFGL